MAKANASRPFIFYFLMIFLTAGWGFIGYNFGQILGAAICVFLAVLVNGYALRIQEEE